jgi:hypothetical protein
MRVPGKGGRLDPAAIQQYRSQLQPGAVLELYSGLAGKPKFHVVICSQSDKTLSFFINTRVSDFIKSRPDAAKRQVLIAKDNSDHSFLDHDSFVACHAVVAIESFRDLALGLHSRRVKCLGHISKQMWAKLASAATGSIEISKADQEKIIAAFEESKATEPGMRE